MGAYQRQKGKRQERAIAADIRTVLPDATVRRSIQSHSAFEPDVVIEGNCPAVCRRLWLEITDSANPQVSAKLEQAEGDAAKSGPDRLPLVVWKKSGARACYASMRLRVLGHITGFRPNEHTADAVVTIQWPVLLAEFARMAAGKAKLDQVAEDIRTCKIAVRSRPTPIPSPLRTQHSLAAARQDIPKLEYVPPEDGHPAEIPIGGQPWSVRYASDLISSQQLMGVTYPIHRQIVLDATMAPDVLGETLTHEFLHACFSTSGLQIDEEVEERLIRAISPFVYSSLKAGARWW